MAPRAGYRAQRCCALQRGVAGGPAGRIHRLGHGRAGGPGVGCRVRGVRLGSAACPARGGAGGLYRVQFPAAPTAPLPGRVRLVGDHGRVLRCATGPGRRPHGTGPRPGGRRRSAVRPAGQAGSGGQPRHRPGRTRADQPQNPARPAASTKLCRVPAELITAVALYGTKTGHFKILLETVQAILSERLRDRFRPYALDQIHGTVIRLDGVADAQAGFVVNLRYLEVTGVPRAMDHARALEILAAHLTPPLSIRIGGYGPGTAATFSSRGQHPHERMFSVQGDAFVLVGWPVSTVTN